MNDLILGVIIGGAMGFGIATILWALILGGENERRRKTQKT